MRTHLDDPAELADLVLALAAGGLADAIFIEPFAEPAAPDATPTPRGAFAIAIEHGARTTRLPLAGPIAAATIARLAFVAELDLATAHAVSGVVRVRLADAGITEVVVTVRPGQALRADVMPLPRARSSRPSLVALADPSELDRGPLPGATIGSYRVLERLGEGGMGVVFRVEHQALGRQYAFKVLRGKLLARDPGASHRFLREARAAARIHHPNIVDVFDFGHLADGRPYFVMELMTGTSLFEVLAGGPLPPAEAVAIARQLASALAAAHDAGVIHADVTPANVYVTARGGGATTTVKLLDFGLAQVAGEVAPDGDDDARPEFVLGTPSYISPEQLRGLPPTDRADQYSLGALLFELLAGAPPYVDADLRELCIKHLTSAIPEVTSPFGPLPPGLVDTITTCLAKAPNARFPSMRALVAALDALEHVTDHADWRRFLPT